MFRTHSPYSPFFTSGLLSAFDRPLPLPRRHDLDVDVPTSPVRRGSLPSDAPMHMREPGGEAAEESAAFYFTLQPRRDEDEFRSFLSLDLAESQSMRSASLKRKASGSTKSRSTQAPSVLPFRFPQIPEVPPVPHTAPLTRAPTPAPAPLRMRFSRDSLRTIPSPKPAPSITLPDLPSLSLPAPPPQQSSVGSSTSTSSAAPAPTSTSSASTPSTTSAPAPPRLPSLAIPAFELSISSLRFSALLSPKLALARSAPSFSFSSAKGKAAHPYPPPVRLDLSKPNPKRGSVATSSTVSTRARRTNRNDALARLEGRVPPNSAPLPRQPVQAQARRPVSARNFMSMSDDEESDSSEEDACSSCSSSHSRSSSSSSSSSSTSSELSFARPSSDLEPPYNHDIAPSLSSSSEHEQTSALNLALLDFPSLPPHAARERPSLDPFMEPEDMVLPPLPPPPPPYSQFSTEQSFLFASASASASTSTLPLPAPFTFAYDSFLEAPRSAPLPPTRSRTPSRKPSRRGEDQLRSFIDLRHGDGMGMGIAHVNASVPNVGLVIGERKDSLPAFRAQQQQQKEGERRKHSHASRSSRKSAKSRGEGGSKENGGTGTGRERGNSWAWRSFIELANVS